MILLGCPATGPPAPAARARKGRELRRDGRPSLVAPRCSARRASAADGGEDRLVVERLLDEVDGARLHRLHRQRNVAMAGDDDDRKVAALALSRRSRSMPVISGMRTSVITQPALAPRQRCEECRADS